MISASDLNEEQKARITVLAEEGASLGEIQKRLAEEFQLSMTYLDARILIGDLGVSLREEEKESPKEIEKETLMGGDSESGESGESGAAAAPVDQAPGEGAVTLSMSEVTPPGMFASGKATFSDGEKAEWYVDERGQLSLNPDTEGYQPSESDVRAFQEELQKLAEREGL